MPKSKISIGVSIYYTIKSIDVKLLAIAKSRSFVSSGINILRQLLFPSVFFAKSPFGLQVNL